MSYRLGIGDVEGDLTWNYSAMWYAWNPTVSHYVVNNSTLSMVAVSRGGIRPLNGMGRDEGIAFLKSFLRYLERHEDSMRALEPANGWGTYDHLTGRLAEWLDDAAEQDSDDRWVLC